MVGGFEVGYNAGSSGTYSLSGTSLLSCPTAYETVGFLGTGSFTQTGGTNVAAYLALAANSGAVGTYSLSGAGLLSVPYEYVSDGGTGTLTQSGGTNVVSSLTLSSIIPPIGQGTYNLYGGLLVPSSLSAGGGTAAFNFTGGTIQAGASFSSSVPITVGTASSNVATIETDGTNAMTLSGPLTGPGGLTKIGSGMLTLTGSDTYTGPTLVNAGTLAIGSGGVLQGTSAVTAQSGGAISLATSALLSTTGTEYVGNSSTGNFLQSGGTNSPATLSLGYTTGGFGAYTLNSGLLSSTAVEFVGYSGSGAGTFTQTGGTNYSASDLNLGYLSGSSSGTYNLSGGSLHVSSNDRVGFYGQATFNQTGGTHYGGYLMVGTRGGSTGTYNLRRRLAVRGRGVPRLLGHGNTRDRRDEQYPRLLSGLQRRPWNLHAQRHVVAVDDYEHAIRGLQRYRNLHAIRRHEYCQHALPRECRRFEGRV